MSSERLAGPRATGNLGPNATIAVSGVLLPLGVFPVLLEDGKRTEESVAFSQGESIPERCRRVPHIG